MKPQADERLNTMLILRKLADIENIEVEEGEVTAEIDNLLSSTGGESEAAMKQALNTENAKESIRSSLMNRKIMARLVELVQGEASANQTAGITTESKENQGNEPEEGYSPAEEATE
jgi:FKBP-type peptidyl-prolyl cis-trans isomerase (trigger factor)